MKKILFVVLIASCAVVFGFTAWPREAEVPVEVPVVVEEVEEMTYAEFVQVKAEFVQLVNQENPRVALDALDSRMQTDKQLLLSCHPLVHEIGHAAFEKYNDFDRALSYASETCNTGYLHGVIEEYFTHEPDALDDLESVCSGYDLGRCLHGVGHGVMFATDNDLPKSLELCDSFEEPSAQSFCAQGAFMENFNADQKTHISKFLNPENPFYPCNEQPTNKKYSCYYYAPTYYLNLHERDYAAALAWCETAERGFASTCVRGVGSLAMKHNIHDTKSVEAICMSAPAERVDDCIDGMVGLFLNNYDSLYVAGLLCDILEPQNRATCRQALETRKYLFTD